MGNCIYYNSPYNNNYNKKECLICWEPIKNPNHFVQCINCNIFIHHKCITSFNLQKNKQIINICPHCQELNVLYLYLKDEYKIL
jgi:hypothetical protein